MVATVDAFLNAGVAPDAVGEMVLRGVLDNALYIHTDRIMEAPIQARTRALLDALPARRADAPRESPRDFELQFPRVSAPIASQAAGSRTGQEYACVCRLCFALVAVLGAGPAIADEHPLKEAYFGETHVHTRWSFDAYIFGNTIDESSRRVQVRARVSPSSIRWATTSRSRRPSTGWA